MVLYACDAVGSMVSLFVFYNTMDNTEQDNNLTYDSMLEFNMQQHYLRNRIPTPAVPENTMLNSVIGILFVIGVIVVLALLIWL